MSCRPSTCDDVILVGGSMGGNTIWSYVDQFTADRVRAIAIIDQTPKMLNTPDWPHGFYGYDASNIDTYFAEKIPDTGKGTPVFKRGMRLVRMLSALKGVDRDLDARGTRPARRPREGGLARDDRPDRRAGAVRRGGRERIVAEQRTRRPRRRSPRGGRRS